jgi:ribosomal protein L3 glutamine methyltransferase
MNTNELETVLDWVRYVCSQLNQNQIFLGHGFEHAWDEAIEIVYFTLNFSHFFPQDISSARLTTEEKKHILQLLQKRVEEKIPVP